MSFLKNIKQRYRYSIILLRQLVITDFKIRYKGSVLGYLWTLLRPLALFAVLYVVFVNFLRIGSDIPHYAVYLLLGVVLWNYFVEVTNNGVSAIVGKGDLLRKLSFPRYVIVLSSSFSALINLSINLLVIGVFMLINRVEFTFNILWIIPLVFELFVFALSISFILSALFVRLRDVNYVWELVLQAGFYATPIIYPISMIVAQSPIAAKILIINPMAQIIQDARHFLITAESPTINSIYDSNLARLMPILLVILIAIFGSMYFKKKSPSFAEEV